MAERGRKTTFKIILAEEKEREEKWIDYDNEFKPLKRSREREGSNVGQRS